MRTHRSCLICLCILIFSNPGGNLLVMAEDWPSIRGPHFDGSARGADLGSSSVKLRVVWKRKAGSGYSGVVASGKQVVSAMADKTNDKEYVICMSAETGKTLWRTETGPMMKGENGSFDGPVATPAVDEANVYHLSPQGLLAAYDRNDGKLVWSHHLKNDFGVAPNFYGFGASPVLHDGRLILNVGSPTAAVMAFDTANGKVVWKAGEDGASFQTPIVVDSEDEKIIVAAGNTKLFAIRPSDGTVLWSQNHGGAEGFPAMSVVPVPLPNGGVFIADQKISSTALNLKNDRATERWSGREIRNSYCVPVVSGGLLCSYSSRILVAVDPETGKRVWRSRYPGDGFLATIDGRLVIATLKGTLHVGSVSVEGFEEQTSASVFQSGADGEDGMLWALPSVSGNRIYLRSLGAIARIDIESGEPSQLAQSRESKVSSGFKAFLEEVENADDKPAVIDRFLAGKSTPIIDEEIVHFVLRGDHQDVAVASELFGVRQERPMVRVEGTDFFYFGTPVSGDTRASYVFYADFHAMPDPLNSNRFESTLLAGEMEPMFIGPEQTIEFSWFDKGSSTTSLANLDKNPDAIKGSVDSFQLDSKMLRDRVDIDVYLPDGYNDSDQSYPVVFVHDGKVAQEQGNQVAIVDELVSNGAIRPVVVVFIGRRFYPLQGADGYVEMFTGELLPNIFERYRISEDRADRACLGGGFGATLAMMGTLPSSDKVSKIGCHSPFAFELLHPVLRMLSTLPNPRCNVLIHWGKYEFRNPAENWNMAKQALAIAEILGEGKHEVIAKEVPIGTDWPSWKTQSEEMWKFLAGAPESE